VGVQFRQKCRVCGELVTGQAGVALDANLARGQETPAVRQDPVGAPVQLEHVVEVPWVDLEVAPIGGDFAVAQKLGLGGGGQRLRVSHGHGRRQVPEVTLHDVQRDTSVEQVGGDRMPESVGAVEVDHGADVVPHVQAGGQLGQQGP
jgi:hypothetical protein